MVCSVDPTLTQSRVKFNYGSCPWAVQRAYHKLGRHSAGGDAPEHKPFGRHQCVTVWEAA